MTTRTTLFPTQLRRSMIAGLVLAGALVALPATSSASEIGTSQRFGIGLVLGYPDIGLSINYFFSSSVSLQVDPTLHLGRDNNAVGGRVDLLFWMPRLATWEVANLRWYVGPGANLGLGLGNNGGFGLGAELPTGIGLQFNSVPIDLNLEAVPVLYIIEELHFGIGGALNARYYF